MPFDDEFFELLFEQICRFGFSGRRMLGNNGDRAGPNCEEASVGETGDYFVRSVGIDFELFTEGADRRKFVARTGLAGNYGLGGGVDNLLADGSAGFEFHTKRNYSAYYSG